MSKGWYNPRSTRRPKNWSKVRRRVLHRDQWRCQLRLQGCAGAASEVDHIVPNDDHSLANLQAVCSVCHRVKTEGERRAGVERFQQRRVRAVEPHPGEVV